MTSRRFNEKPGIIDISYTDKRRGQNKYERKGKRKAK